MFLISFIMPFLVSLSFAASDVTLKKGNLDGTDWSTSEMKGKLSVVFYVDPDKKNLNNKTSEALKAKNYDLEKVGFYGIINMKATWLPNIAISRSLKAKQAKYKRTKYIKDYNTYLVKGWSFEPKGNDIFVFDSEGNELFKHFGKLSEERTQELLTLLDEKTK